MGTGEEPGRPVVVSGGRVIRYAQEALPRYGSRVRAFEIFKISPSDYEEREAASGPVLDAGRSGWNSERMHHVDPHQVERGCWTASVDGAGKFLAFWLKR